MHTTFTPSHAALRTFVQHGIGDLHSVNYPKYNIVKTSTGFRIEMAVPGWEKNDLDVSILGNKLEIRGLVKQELPKNETYVERGLSGKPFRKLFELNKHIQVQDTYMRKGMLCINLVHEVPEHELPKKFNIN